VSDQSIDRTTLPIRRPPFQGATAEAPAELDDVAQIQQYAALNEQGVITDEEFTAKKKQILGI
jgi:hypothetical protein